MNDEALIKFQHYFSQQNWDAAQQVVQTAIRAHPSDWNAIYLSGVIRRLQGDYHGAIALYQRALQINAEDDAIWHALGIAYQQLRDYSAAIEALTRAAQIQPARYETHNSLGITYKLAGDYGAAMCAYQRALDICAERAFDKLLKYPDRYFSVTDQADGRVFSLKPAYFTIMRQTLTTDFNYFNTIKNMASCCYAMGDHNRAHELMEIADTCTPIDADLIGPIHRRSQ
jgi:tetratricopeptide (TPR) repeat protein